MHNEWRSSLFSAIAALFLMVAIFVGVLAFQANERRWHQGPVLMRISPTHGLHEMDLLLTGAAIASAMVALLAAVIARR